MRFASGHPELPDDPSPGKREGMDRRWRGEGDPCGHGGWRYAGGCSEGRAGGHFEGHGTRLNLLLTAGGWHEDPWVHAVPQVLEPHGVAVLRARSGVEATGIIRMHAVHIAVVDLGLPLDSSTLGGEPGGTRVIQLLRRLDQPPPMVVVRPPQPTRRENSRSLLDALMDGAFSVVDRPCHPETMLRVLHRVVERYYPDRWQGPGTGHTTRGD